MPRGRPPVGHPTRLLVGLLVRPEHGAEAGEHEGAQALGSLLVAAVVVQGVGGQHEPVLPRPDPGGLDASPHLPLQPAWEGEASAPATSPIHPAGCPCPLPCATLGWHPARRGTILPTPAVNPGVGQKIKPCSAAPTFHQSIGVLLHRPRPLLHDETAHLLRHEQGPGDIAGLSPGALRSPPSPQKWGSTVPQQRGATSPGGTGHPATPRWERGTAIGCR